MRRKREITESVKKKVETTERKRRERTERCGKKVEATERGLYVFFYMFICF